MSQYRVGLATVINGSPTITGLGTLWIANASAGNLFMIQGETTIYIIDSVDSNTQITLTENYVGTSSSGKSYAITKELTTNFEWYKTTIGDKDWPTLLTQKFIEPLDQLLWNATHGIEITVTDSTAGITLTFDEYTHQVLEFIDGGLTGNVDIIVPLTPYRVWIVINKVPAQSVTIIGPTGTGVLIGADRAATVYTNGTNIVRTSADCDPSS